jgi:hypothetical protein
VVHDHGRGGPQPTSVVSSHPGSFAPGRWSFPGIEIGVEGDLGPGGPTFETPGGTRFSLLL